MTKRLAKVHYFVGGGSIACGTREAHIVTSDVTKLTCVSCLKILPPLERRRVRMIRRDKMMEGS